MRHCFLVVCCLLVSVFLFGGLLTSVGYALRQPINPPTLSFSEPSQPAITQLTFPCTVDGTTLVAENLALYEGSFLENGSDIFVSDVAALMLYNTGAQEILRAEVILEMADGFLVFQGNHIPANSRVLILEQDGAPWTEGPFYDCTGTAELTENKALPETAVHIQEVDMGTISVTNETDSVLSNLRIYHKNYLQDEEIYVGGITYCTQVACLPPGEHILLPLKHYASGYSKIVWVETE